MKDMQIALSRLASRVALGMLEVLHARMEQRLMPKGCPAPFAAHWSNLRVLISRHFKKSRGIK